MPPHFELDERTQIPKSEPKIRIQRQGGVVVALIGGVNISIPYQQDQDENEDKENGETWNSTTNIKKRSNKNLGTISTSANINNFCNGSGSKSLKAPSSSRKDKSPLTASFLVA